MLDLFTLAATMGLQEEMAGQDKSKVIRPDAEETDSKPTLLSNAADELASTYESVEASFLNAASVVSESLSLDGLFGGDSQDRVANPFVIDLTLPPPPLRVSTK